jgi:hypothetical protein
MQAALAAALPALVQQVERVRSALNVYGVSNERMRGHISIGIDVLVTRFDRQVSGLKEDNARKQAQIDALMLEYCPDEMTPQQVENWGNRQRRASPEQEAAINAALGLDAATAQAKQAEGGK